MHGRGIEVHGLQDLGDARLALGARGQAVGVEALGHDLPHGHARAEAAVRVLEHDLKLRRMSRT